MRVRKKPVVVEAVRWDGRDATFAEIEKMAPGAKKLHRLGAVMSVITLEGTMSASLGDWIIRGVKGEIYPCKPDIFAATYSPEPSPSPDSREGCKESGCWHSEACLKARAAPSPSPENEERADAEEKSPLTDLVVSAIGPWFVEEMGHPFSMPEPGEFMEDEEYAKFCIERALEEVAEKSTLTPSAGEEEISDYAEVEAFCVAFVTEQSCGEWDDATINADAVKLAAAMFAREKALRASKPSAAEEVQAAMKEADRIATAIAQAVLSAQVGRLLDDERLGHLRQLARDYHAALSTASKPAPSGGRGGA